MAFDPLQSVFTSPACLVLPNSSELVATSYMEPKYGASEHEVKEWKAVPPFTATNFSKLAAWARFGTLTLFKARLLLLYVLVLSNSSRLVASSHMEPKWSLWTYTEGMVGLFSILGQQTSLNWLPGPDWHFDPLRSAFTPPVHVGAPKLC